VTTRASRGPRVSEADFQRRVIDTAKLLGWRVVHIRPAWVRTGRMVTPYEGDPGLPDLVLARRGRVLLVELKSDIGKPTRDQLAWLEAAGPNGHLWQPRDWPTVQTVLAAPAVDQPSIPVRPPSAAAQPTGGDPT
jgi:hypothetical protein